MFEKHLTATIALIYGLMCTGAALWLAWICFTSLSFVIALLVFSLSFVALAAALAPVAAGVSLAAGLLVACLIFGLRKAIGRSGT